MVDLNEIIDEQTKINTEVYGRESSDKDLSIMTRAAIHEICELEDELGISRDWRDQTIDPAKIKEEFTDVFIFVIGIAGLLGISGDELAKMFYEKNVVNLKRQIERDN